MKLIKLRNNEFFYIISKDFLPVEMIEMIKQSCEKYGFNYLLNISEDEADQLRDLFSDQLQVVGFDENDNLTKEGQMIENLIDKFFIG